jgi:hypothetical protein
MKTTYVILAVLAVGAIVYYFTKKKCNCSDTAEPSERKAAPRRPTFCGTGYTWDGKECLLIK